MSIKQQVVDRLEGKKAEESFPITSVCKDDLRETFKGDKEALKKIDEMDEHDMKYLATDLADDYCNQLFWDSLRIIFESGFLEK